MEGVILFDTKTDYALNKRDPNAIVYRGADGAITRLTREDFPSEAEFHFWKAWSDTAYHETEKQDQKYKKHVVSLELAPPHTDLPESDEDAARKCRLLLARLRSILSKKQFRRLCLYRLAHLTEAEIAHLEGVSQQGVSDCLTRITKKIEKLKEKTL